MCKCKQAVSWVVVADADEWSNQNGYDGDIDDDEDTSEWHAYSLTSYRICSRCDDKEAIDSLGAVWVTPADLTSSVLNNAIIGYGLVPAHIRDWTVEDYLA